MQIIPLVIVTNAMLWTVELATRFSRLIAFSLCTLNTKMKNSADLNQFVNRQYNKAGEESPQ